MRAFLMSIIVLCSVLFFVLDYSYFYFGSDFYTKNNVLVGLLLSILYFLGFFLGRFFPFFGDEDAVNPDLQEIQMKNKGEKVDFQDIDETNFFSLKKDNLQLIEGIGPKVQELLYENGIYTFSQLSESTPAKLKYILDLGGDRFQLCNPETWPYQGELAAKKDWSKLKEYQDFLLRGEE